MKKIELGWNSYFEEQLNTLDIGNKSIGRVACVQKSAYLIYGEDEELWGKISGALMHHAELKSDFPVVGDWVIYSYQPGDESAMIHIVLERRNKIVRKEAGSRFSKTDSFQSEQIMAANLDTVFIVCGLDRDFNVRRIERYLTLVYNSDAMPVIVLTKADICPDVEVKRFEVESVAMGVPIHAINALDAEDTVQLKRYILSGYTVALLGSSGVGKSTIINALLGAKRQKVRSVSQKVKKGTHTTTTRELISLEDGGLIIDTPGMRELLLTVDQTAMETSFEDIYSVAQQCRFTDCSHTVEPDCAVLDAIRNGELDENRLHSFYKLQKEIVYVSERQEKSSRTIEKEKWKKIRIIQRQMKKK